MKYAPVVPEYVLDAIPEECDYHLVLSNQLLKSERMRSFYEMQGERGRTVIMDNPVHERLEIPSFSERCYMAVTVRPTVMVAPDIIGEAEESYNLYLREINLMKHIPLMAVVQGRTWNDYMFSIQHLVRHATYIGIPLIRRFEQIDRADFIFDLTERGFFREFPHLRIHLLGSDHLMKDIRNLRCHPNVMGFDSAKPIYLGLKGVHISKAKEGDWGRPDWYFDRTDPLSLRESELIRANILEMLEFVS